MNDIKSFDANSIIGDCGASLSRGWLILENSDDNLAYRNHASNDKLNSNAWETSLLRCHRNLVSVDSKHNDKLNRDFATAIVTLEAQTRRCY